MTGRGFRSLRAIFLRFFGTYITVKEIEVRNTYIAVIHRILQFLVATYIFLYIVWIKKGYQDVQEPYGSSISKVKGIARVSISNSNFNDDNVKQSLWDAADYLIPPIENNAFFIATRKTVTYKQTVGTCPSAMSEKLFCNSTQNPCEKGLPAPNSLGVLTGNCVPVKKNMKKKVCEINAWCPEELTDSIRTVKKNTDFSCRFNMDTDPRCPIFSIGYILQKLHSQDSKIDLIDLYHQGGLIEIQQKWKCNFDSDSEKKECFPTFYFNLLQSGSDELSPGINYRFAEKYNINKTEYRTLTKVYGLRFVLSIRGKGRRFDVVRLFVAIGSGVGYTIFAQIICEIILRRCHKYRDEYRRHKVKICRLNLSTNNNNPTDLATIVDTFLAEPSVLPDTIRQSDV
ncbi:unnamed protein product [Adineta steineri]|uniref:P2X purinoceptor n=1 Tax=Adineta steineri TaxID=433720 RepID=A0A813NHW7_9BILA|nr:unnamed protein product [Adineta steineri]